MYYDKYKYFIEELKKDGMKIKNIPKTYYDNNMFRTALNNNPLSLQFIENQNLELCLLACCLDIRALRYVGEDFFSYVKYVQMCKYSFLHFIKKQNKNVCLKELKKKEENYNYIKNKNKIKYLVMIKNINKF